MPVETGNPTEPLKIALNAHTYPGNRDTTEARTAPIELDQNGRVKTAPPFAPMLGVHTLDVGENLTITISGGTGVDVRGLYYECREDVIVAKKISASVTTGAETTVASGTTGASNIIAMLTLYNLDASARTVTVKCGTRIVGFFSLGAAGNESAYRVAIGSTGGSASSTPSVDGTSINYNGSAQLQRMALTGPVTASAGSGATALSSALSQALTNGNVLINPDGTIQQRWAAATNYDLTADGYQFDRWKSQTENSGVRATRGDGHGQTGITARNYMIFTKINNAGKILVMQKIEGANMAHLKGQTVVVQAMLLAGTLSGNKVRFGLFELQNAGTMDTVPDFTGLNGATGTDPTVGANVAKIAPVSNISTGTASIVNNALDCTLTSGWQRFAFTATIPSNSKNLIFAIWADQDMSVSDAFAVTEAGLYLADTAQPWKARPVPLELALCQRYCWGSVTTAGAFEILATGVTFTGTATAKISIPLRVTMRAVPTITVTAADWTITDGGASPASLGTFTIATNSTPDLIYCDGTPNAGTPWTVGRCGVLYSIASGKRFYMEAEL